MYQQKQENYLKMTEKINDFFNQRNYQNKIKKFMKLEIQSDMRTQLELCMANDDLNEVNWNLKTARDEISEKWEYFNTKRHYKELEETVDSKETDSKETDSKETRAEKERVRKLAWYHKHKVEQCAKKRERYKQKKEGTYVAPPKKEKMTEEEKKQKKKDQNAAYYKSNKDSVDKKATNWKKNNPDKAAAQTAKYYQKNKETILAKKKAHNQTEHAKALRRANYAKKKDEINAKKRAYRALKKAEKEILNTKIKELQEKTNAMPNIPKPFDVYGGDAASIIMCFNTFDNYEQEIWKYYSKSKYWLKHKNDEYFLLIEDGKKLQ